jgi:pimeloyl-ACP methyl ester carboxylesterase
LTADAQNMKLVPFSLLVSLLLTLVGCRSVNKTQAPALAPGRVLEIGGEQLFVRQTGTGPDVVLLHGLADSSIGWQFIEPGLVQAGYRVTTWDALGRGRSGKPAKGDYSIPAHVKRLEKMVDILGIREAVFVGHSLGGAEALLFAARNPERVRALCLIDPAAYRAGVEHGRWFWTTPLVAETVLGFISSQTYVRIVLNRNFHDRTAISRLIEASYLREARRPRATAALIAQERQLAPKEAENWKQANCSVGAPTLILWGQQDEVLPSAQGQRLAEDIPGSSLVVFPSVGHSPLLEAPSLVLEQLLPFLKEVNLQ